MAHQPGPGGLPLLDRVLVPLLRLAWWLPTRWQQAERHTVAMQTSSDPTVRVREARAALAAFQAAERYHTSRRRREAHLPSMAAAALEAGELDAAAAYAQQMLAGDTDGAAQHLLRAGSTPGSPQLDAFGPDLSLANQLLAHGRTDAVEDYLRRCQRFWKLGGDKLQRWITQIHTGHRPTLNP